MDGMDAIRQKVVLVDADDREIGLEDKLAAHQNGGKLHRAISVFIFDSKGRLMLQRRALTKWNEPGKWSSSTCSHPFKGESNEHAAHRRLMEEMGFDCPMKEACSFEYEAVTGKLIEHEYDHFFAGIYDKEPKLNKEETDDWKFMPIDAIKKDMRENPSNYTGFFHAFFDRAMKGIEKSGILKKV